MTDTEWIEAKRRVYARVGARPDVLAEASHALHGGPPSPEQMTELLDFAAIEWVDAEGWTAVDRAVADGELPPACARWSREVATSLWVVDGWCADTVQLRDVATEAVVEVHAPGQASDLPRRAVLRARVLPAGDRRVLSGAPDVWEPMGVIARMELLAQWQASGEPALLANLRELRAGFVRQREERAVWIAHFGADLVVFDDASDLERRLAAFANVLLNEARFPSLDGRTRAEAYTASKGEEPKVVMLRLGQTLTGPGRHGAIYDGAEGIHFLPDLGSFLDYFEGRSSDATVVRAYLADPGVTMLPFLRVGGSARLAALLGVDDAPMDVLLAPYKSPIRPLPNFLPGHEDPPPI